MDGITIGNFGFNCIEFCEKKARDGGSEEKESRRGSY